MGLNGESAIKVRDSSAGNCTLAMAVLYPNYIKVLLLQQSSNEKGITEKKSHIFYGKSIIDGETVYGKCLQNEHNDGFLMYKYFSNEIVIADNFFHLHNKLALSREKRRISRLKLCANKKVHMKYCLQLLEKDFSSQ